MNINPTAKLKKRMRRVLKRVGILRSKPPVPRKHQLVFFFNGAEQDLRRDLNALWNNTVFYKTLERASAWVYMSRNWSPLYYLRDDADYPNVIPIEKKLVSIVLVQIAIYEMYRAWGVTPMAVAGISAGEITAAYVAGAGEMQDAVQMAILGARLIVEAGKGKCFQMERLEPALQSELKTLNAHLIVDAPTRQLWAVPPEIEPAVRGWLQEHHIEAHVVSRFMPHTPLLSRSSFEAGLANLEPHTPRLPLYSGELGGRIPGALDMAHWWRVIAAPVQSSKLFPALIQDGYDVLLDMGAGGETMGTLRASMSGSPYVHILDGVARDPAMIMPPETRTVLQGLGFDLSETILEQHRRIGTPPPPDDRALSSPPPLDLDDPRFLQDPFGCYRLWRKMAPVHYLTRQNAWLILDYKDVAAILRDPMRFSSSPYQQYSALLSGNDPPDHTRVRHLLTPYFARQDMLARAPQIEQTVRRYVDALRSQHTFEFVSAFARPAPRALTAELLGIQLERFEQVREEIAQNPSLDVLQAALTGDGLIPRLIADEAIPRHEIIPLTEFMIGAGMITIKDVLTNGLYTLLRQPQWMEEIRAHPEQIANLTEELIRLEPPILTLLRRTRTPVEIAGVAIPQNALLYLGIGAANHDPDRFPRPDDLVLERPAPRYLSFSIGPHHCLGVHLGRLECEILFRLLLTELPPLRAAKPLNEVRFAGAPHTRGIPTMHVGFA